MNELKLETLIKVYNNLGKNMVLAGQCMDKVKELAKNLYGVDIANNRSVN